MIYPPLKKINNLTLKKIDESEELEVLNSRDFKQPFSYENKLLK